MSESKPKANQKPGLREPKAKKTLGLTVPQALRMPHEDLFPARRSENAPGAANEPVAEPDRTESNAGAKLELVASPDRLTADTSIINEPDSRTNQPGYNTGSESEPASNSNRFNFDTSPELVPTSNPDRSKTNTSSETKPVSSEPVSKTLPAVKANRSKSSTSPFLPPVTTPNLYKEPTQRYFKTPNEVSDIVQARLSDEEFSLYFRLFRLSHGHKQSTCFVGYSALARALGWSLSKVKRIMPKLLNSGFVRLVEAYNAEDLKGTVYEVFTGVNYEPVSIPNQSESDTSSDNRPNKGDDLDHKENPHQSAVRRIYTELTGRQWTQGDDAHYARVTSMTVEEVELQMRLIHGRSATPIRSFAFFATSIENELIADEGEQSRAYLEKSYREIARQLAATYTGRDQAPSDQIARLKARCIREGLNWDNDIANDVLGL